MPELQWPQLSANPHPTASNHDWVFQAAEKIKQQSS